ncbi:MAG: hypothetical protein A3C30_01130 [Candidatus Levybacteria bacterium RIFCSPHIGHO2_02_FULL_40_18]|nr:MAG: hypothetical protein A2869_03555 [Candidatus Levybacteria bacterium RIFCSPHIGHO2_01_FULL_40_58]OGH27309.1 MAG: hypothetical protein A3C30_01130 [Candidatus Levybacteria bacterium RIFCSPHIGHO2_02_FULL_40_18]OGH30924.1 MAG: hypothetical protein A3E43_04275 [Candidatus Levybacteria bacterium RIFCSPHIGHO2_12_FULL_40_31]OGH40935.1 MAG: hypothetical protein A2894_01490 [Candidatus Levybacteria bacterium RIFCSPLOWO2_01_FULL_40_64]OGH48988.1 MAG: hypothetical protein A3I54_03065 [Candidatus Lev
MNFQSNMIQEKEFPQRLKGFLKFFLGAPLTIISLLFITRFIYSGKSEIFSQVSSFSILPFLLGFFFLILFFFFRSLAWRELLANDGYIVGTAESTFLLANAEIKRYIPGSILSFLTRIHNFNLLKVPARSTVKLILYESILFVATSALISTPAVFYFFPEFPIIIFIILITIIIVISGVTLRKRVHPLRFFETPFILMLLAWVFYGLGNYLVATAIIYIDPSKILEVSSFFVLSWLAGYLVLVVPMGIGVREGVTTFGLSMLMPISIAASIALFTRVILVVSEVLFLALSYFVRRFIRIKRKIENHVLILWASIISYVVYFTYYSFERHANFFTGRFDLGNMDQTVWNTLNGRIFQLTNPDGINTISRLAIHSDFILILLAPFYLIWEDPRTLLFIQTVVLGLGAYFVYLIASHILRNNTISTVLGISFLLNPFVQKQNLFDFHAVVLSTTFLLAAFYFTLIKNYRYFFLFLFLSVLTKENLYLIASIFGIYLFLKTSREAGKNKKWLFLTFGGLSAFYILVAKLIPWARGGQHFAAEYFAEFGDSPFEILINLVVNPLKTAANLITQSNFLYLYKLFLPVGFLSILSPLILFFAAPDLAINLLSKNENFRTLTFHYSATIIPFMYIAAIFGLKQILNLKFKFLTPKIVLYFLIVFSIASTYRYGVLPGSKNPSLEIYDRYLQERDQIKRFLENIPQDLSVASTNNLGAHLSHREKIYTVPYGVNEADVVVFLLNDPYAQPSLSEQRELANNIQNNSFYIELYRTGDFIAFAKRSVAGRIQSAY